jgi:poly-gamma-glutamate synthesis protein (capsule biosynthesis protein)
LAHARTPAIIEIKGWKIGFLGYHGARKFAATPTRAGLAPRTLRLILEDVRALKARTDYVVVNFHWGEELATQPDPEQMRFAHQVVDAGADLIVGHHPHVLQGIELYRGATIAYSLGNFLFGGNARHSYDTAVLKVVLNDGGPRVTLVPVAVRRWQPMLADEATTRRVNNLVQERSALFRRPFPISTNTSE